MCMNDYGDLVNWLALHLKFGNDHILASWGGGLFHHVGAYLLLFCPPSTKISGGTHDW